MDNNECGTEGFCGMNQEDAGEDGIGGTCEFCEGEFECDLDVDGLDTLTLKQCMWACVGIKRGVMICPFG